MAELNKIVSFVITSKPVAAKEFYGDTLGFKLLSDDAYALAFAVGDSMLRVSKMKQFTPESYTVLGWEVGDIGAAVRDLAARGVVFERYPGMPLDENGVCTFPNGDKVAWFKDPDGNVLSLSQHKNG
jgi:catechol 2,3-dioxygenase-like lactoylglutathione lyase family enzyme